MRYLFFILVFLTSGFLTAQAPDASGKWIFGNSKLTRDVVIARDYFQLRDVGIDSIRVEADTLLAPDDASLATTAYLYSLINIELRDVEGGLVGPAGPAGVPSDTAVDGSYYRLFTTDDAGTLYTDDPEVDGIAGLEFLTSGEDQLYSIYTQAERLQFDGPNFNFEGSLTSGLMTSNQSAWFLEGSDMNFSFFASGTIFTDSRGTPEGIEYDDDYSATFTDRSLVDKGYVDTQVAGFSFTETNAKSEAGGGGLNAYALLLDSETAVEALSVPYSSVLALDGGGSVGYVGVNEDGKLVLVSDSEVASELQLSGLRRSYLLQDSETLLYSSRNSSGNGVDFTLGHTTNTFEDSRLTTTGILYGGDYSADFVDRSLVDKAYVDGQLALELFYGQTEYEINGDEFENVGIMRENADFQSFIGLVDETSENYPIDIRYWDKNTGDDVSMIFNSANARISYNAVSTLVLNDTMAFLDAQTDIVLDAEDDIVLQSGDDINLESNDDVVVELTGNAASTMRYADDYSAGFVARSLVDKAYVDDNFASQVVGSTEWTNELSDNEEMIGFTTSVNDIENFLGYSEDTGYERVELTSFDVDGYEDYGRIFLKPRNSEWVHGLSTGITQNMSTGVDLFAFNLDITISLNGGSPGQFLYSADYSDNYVDRSIVDKQFVDDGFLAKYDGTPLMNTFYGDGAAIGLRRLNGDTEVFVGYGNAAGKEDVMSLSSFNSTTNDFSLLRVEAGEAYLGAGGAAGGGSFEASTSGLELNAPSSDIIVSVLNGFSFKYDSDVSAAYVDRSIVDKEYVDTEIATAVASIPSIESGTLDVTTVSGAFTIAHTLGEIPSSVQLTIGFDNLDAEVIYYDFDSTTSTVIHGQLYTSAGSAVSDDTYQVSWIAIVN